MTILVTGGCGFVGINVAEALAGIGERAVLFDRNPLPHAAARDFARLASPPRAVMGDVRSAAFLSAVFKEFNVECVIHAAAVTADARRESRDPKSIIDVNLSGTLAVLHAARSAGCRRIVFVGSGAAYGKTHDEGAALKEGISASRPEDLYGISKCAAEQTALRLGSLWDLDVVCVRLGSVCGPWEFATGVRDLLSPQLQVARLAARGQEALIPAVEFWRDWVYSRDVAAGLVELTRAAAPPAAMYHLSSGMDWIGSFPQWCEQLRSHFPRFRWRIAGGEDVPNVTFVVDRDRSPMDITRIVHDIGFQPRFGPTAAYKDYVGWIVAHEDFIAN